MSVIKSHGTKIILPRTGPDEFWQIVLRHYAGEDPRFWKLLAMLALRENAGWPLHCIGNAFGHNKGHVTRCLRQIKGELRLRFQLSPDFLDLPDDHEPVHEHPATADQRPPSRPLQPPRRAAAGRCGV